MSSLFPSLIKRMSSRNERPFDERPIVIACLGDSVTHGSFELSVTETGEIVGVFDPVSVYHNVLRLLLAERFPSAAPSVINAGIGGDSAPGGLKRIERDIVAYNPDLCVVCFGLNDSGGGKDGVERYAKALRGIFAALHAADIPALFMTPNMMNTAVHADLKGGYYEAFAAGTMELQNSGVFDLYKEAARNACAEHNVPVLDEYAKFMSRKARGENTDELLSNHINHPDRATHAEWARDLYELITGEASAGA